MAAAPPPRGSGAIAEAVRIWRDEPHVDRSAAAKDRLVQLWIRAEALRLTNIRGSQNRKAGNPGPEGSIAKLMFAEINKDIYELCIDLLGPAALVDYDYTMRRSENLGLTGAPGTSRKMFLRARANSIEGGTSEVQRNILGERILGLPGEPRGDKDVPWKDVPRADRPGQARRDPRRSARRCRAPARHRGGRRCAVPRGGAGRGRRRAGSAEEYRALVESGRIWVADVGGRPVGYVLATDLGGHVHLDQLSVRPEHGGRGLGSALVEVVMGWARRSGSHVRAPLTTFRDVAWNGPWYERRGFTVDPAAAAEPGLEHVVAWEAEHDFGAPRVWMRRPVHPVDPAGAAEGSAGPE